MWRARGFVLWPIVAQLLGAVSARPAQAYCQSTTVDPESSCPEQCVHTGTPLRWAAPELTFVLNSAGFPGFSDAELRRTVLDSFAAWEDVSCDGKLVEYRFGLAPQATDEGARHDRVGPNQNVLVYEDAASWLALGHSSAAFAVTTVAFSRSTGTISEADIEFNGGMPSWGVCPPEGCGATQLHTDLSDVLTHELGHTLGLAHSDVPEATMSCSALAGETVKRTLAPDDIAGVCATYPPGATFPGLGRVVYGQTCGLLGPRRAASSGFGWAVAMGVAAAAGARSLRRRARLPKRDGAKRVR